MAKPAENPHKEKNGVLQRVPETETDPAVWKGVRVVEKAYHLVLTPPDKATLASTGEYGICTDHHSCSLNPLTLWDSSNWERVLNWGQHRGRQHSPSYLTKSLWTATAFSHGDFTGWSEWGSAPLWVQRATGVPTASSMWPWAWLRHPGNKPLRMPTNMRVQALTPTGISVWASRGWELAGFKY